MVPVYTVNDRNDDTIRAYSKCPTYDSLLKAWYNTSEFLGMSAQTASFRQSISTQLQGWSKIDTSLINW